MNCCDPDVYDDRFDARSAELRLREYQRNGPGAWTTRLIDELAAGGVDGMTVAGLSAYLEALDHKYESQGLTVVNVKPGFVKTSMTAGLKPPPFAGEPDQVARDVLRAIEDKRPVVYTPAAWALVMLIIRWLPRFVMRRIGF